MRQLASSCADSKMTAVASACCRVASCRGVTACWRARSSAHHSEDEFTDERGGSETFSERKIETVGAYTSARTEGVGD